MKNFSLIYFFRLFFCGIFLVFYCSCSKPKAEIPPGILSQKEMIPILVDIHIAHSAAELFKSDTSLTMSDYMSYILSIHHVEKAVYDSSITFYTRHPEIMQDIYDEVINELSKKQGEASSK
jgi:hypothetical protein